MFVYPCDYFHRVYEKIMEKMQEIGSTITGLKKTLADWAKKKGLEGNQNFLKKYVSLIPLLYKCMSCQELMSSWSYIHLYTVLYISSAQMDM